VARSAAAFDVFCSDDGGYCTVLYQPPLLGAIAAGPLPRPADLLQAFETLRFDIEELAEQKIAEQEFAEDGSIYLY